MNRKIHPLIVTLCVAWMTILGGLGVSAVIGEHISIGTRLGVSTSEGMSAIVSGIGLIGFALFGLVPLLQGNRFRTHVIALVTTVWLIGSVCVLRWSH
jgi:hypothetical protein